MRRFFPILFVICSFPCFVFAQEATPYDPVLIIPGILGTKIYKDYGDGAELWPRIAALVTSPSDSFLEDLGLSPEGKEIIERPMKLGDIVRSVSFGIDVHPFLVARMVVTASHIFDRFIESMESRGYQEGVDLFVFPYDWRLGSAVNADSLKVAIDNILSTTGKSKINIVAHSMGGLVLKSYLAMYGFDAIQNIFFIGTPHYGAPKALKALMYGDDMGIRVPIKGKFSSLLSPGTIKSISQNMPSVYELLPSESYVTTAKYVTKDGVDLEYGDIGNLLSSSGRNGGLVEGAEKFHENIDAIAVKPNTYNFIGCDDGQNTLGSIEIKKKKPWLSFFGEAEDFFLHFVKGDETVPMASAYLSGANNYFIKGVSHSELPSTDGLGDLIANALNGIQRDLPSTISKDPQICNGASGIIISKHSPVEMHIYDNNGNHTGPTDSGDIEFGIPGVTYEQIGTTAYAYIPMGEQYRIVNIPTNSGAFDFYAEYVDKDDVVIKKQVWSEVPISSTDSSFELSVSENGIEKIIEHDQQEVVGEIKPTSTLVGQSLSDKTPPKTSVSVDESKIILSAQDDVAGVEKIMYSFDKETWNEYKVSIPAVTSQPIFFLSMDRAGNIEDMNTFVVPEEKAELVEKKNIYGNKPKRIEEPVKVANQIPVEQVPATEVNSVEQEKKVVKPKAKVRRRRLVMTNIPEKSADKVLMKKKENGKKSALITIWNKVKSALYYVIWQVKAIIL